MAKDKKQKVKDNVEKEEKKPNFFKKVWYSIDKLDKYSELASYGIKSSLKYMLIFILVLSAIVSILQLYKTDEQVKKIANTISEKSPEFEYKDGKLSVDWQGETTDDDFGLVIVDTNTDDEDKIKEYEDKIQQESNAVLILKDKAILIQPSGVGSSRIRSDNKYEDLAKDLDLTEFNKEELIDHINGTGMYKLYGNLFFTLILEAIVVYIINMFAYVLLLALIGYMVEKILKLHIKFSAIFNMSIYALTLSMLLEIVYRIANSIWGYKMDAFSVMYVLIASIYIIAALFNIRDDMNKKQKELQKIRDAEKDVREEMDKKLEEEQKEENRRKEEKQNEKNNDTNDNKNEKNEKDKNSKDDKKLNDGETPQEA